MKRIVINSNLSIEEAFSNYIIIKSSEGLADKTLECYRNHFKCISNYMDTTKLFSQLTQSDLQQMIIDMRNARLSSNSIASYIRVLRAFLSWANREGISEISIPAYKAEETIKDTYSDEELLLLLRKPNLNNCSFIEYRTWVIICFMLNCGARAATVRNITIQDIDLSNGLITYRHNKNKRVQSIPLCSQMISILKEYLHFRDGEPTDYLFCTEYGDMLTEQGLRSSIRRYNASRGVIKTSIHMFRHTFAKKFLIDGSGDAFTLQRILGHSTLEMTRHYCNIYNVDISKRYDSFSPLQNMSKSKRITMR